MEGSRMAVGSTTAGFLKYVEGATDRGVGAIELGRLGQAANLRDRIAGVVEDWVRAMAEALFAKWVRERRAILEGAESTLSLCPGCRSRLNSQHELMRGEIPGQGQELARKLPGVTTRILNSAGASRKIRVQQKLEERRRPRSARDLPPKKRQPGAGAVLV